LPRSWRTWCRPIGAQRIGDLRDQLLAVPNGAFVVMPQALRGAISAKEVDAAVRFMAARVDDQIAALQYALGKA
jgi:hypothetical protein